MDTIRNIFLTIFNEHQNTFSQSAFKGPSDDTFYHHLLICLNWKFQEKFLASVFFFFNVLILFTKKRPKVLLYEK